MQIWSKITRYLHAAIALSITTQLILSLILAPPDELEDAGELAKMAMEGHEVVGLIAAGLLLLHWLWILMANSEIKLGDLFPLSANGMQRIQSEISELVKKKALPAAGQHGGLSGLVHGLGILIASVMAATGVGLYVVMDFTTQGFENPLFEEIAEIHELFGSLMWAYLIAHVIATAWHEYSGERIISRILPF
jgi:cytochrome b561